MYLQHSVQSIKLIHCKQRNKLPWQMQNKCILQNFGLGQQSPRIVAFLVYFIR